MQEEIIDAIDKDLIEQELTKEVFVRKTNYLDNSIYIIDNTNAPNTLREIGRLREISFRDAGAGTGKSIDLDEFDLEDGFYKQLIVYNHQDREIIGGYRFIDLKDCKFNLEGEPLLSTSEIFAFNQKFVEEYMPQTIELGRSFVQPKYQSKNNYRQALFALDNLWDGLGAIYKLNQDHINYFFGKVTMYTSYNTLARNYILAFIDKYFADNQKLVYPKEKLFIEQPFSKFQEVFVGKDYKENYKILNKLVRDLGENIPPLVNAYMNLSPTMKCFGTALNPFFGDVEETGILINIQDIYFEKKSRHIDTFEVI